LEMIGNITYIPNYILIYLNLELGSDNWDLPEDFELCKKIYSNSLNMGRIDVSKFIFEFNTNVLDSDHIVVSSLFSNMIPYFQDKFYN
jgi:hypothetical protein